MKVLKSVHTSHKGDFFGNKYECYDYTIHSVLTFENYLKLVNSLSIIKSPVSSVHNVELTKAIQTIDDFINDLTTIAE